MPTTPIISSPPIVGHDPPMPLPPIFAGPTDPPATHYGLDYVPAIDFAEKDPAVIQQQVIADYEAAFLALTSIAKALAPGDPVRLFLLVVVNWLSQQRVLIDFTGKQNLLKYAKGDYLDNLAALHGIRALRQPASPALTTLEFSLAVPLAFDVLIPAGTQCQAPNAVVFETLAPAGISTTTLTAQVPARALQTGLIGNGFIPGQINSIINWNQRFAVSVTNTTETAGGSDGETDDQYRYRIWLAIESYSTCGPRDAYEFWALSAHPDIIQCVVHSAPEIAGEVHLYPLMRGGELPTPEILQLVLDKCSDDRVRPITDYVFAHSPTAFTYTLDITYFIRESDETLLTSIDTGVRQAVADWILWQRSNVGRDLIGDELVRRCLEAGAKRIAFTSPSPSFQELAYNQLACHDPAVEPVIGYGGIEEE